jgi:hypothetical protein
MDIDTGLRLGDEISARLTNDNYCLILGLASE